MLDIALGAAAVCGHDPRDVREWPWADVERFLAAFFA